MKFIAALMLGFITPAIGADIRTTPRVESVVPIAKQPEEAANTTIWFDDFTLKKQ